MQRRERGAGPGGLVRVREYRCTACDGDPPRLEQFERASIAIVRSGVFGIRTGKRPQLLSTGFLLLGNPGQNYEASHDHGVGDRCIVFDFRGSVIEELSQLFRQGSGAEPVRSQRAAAAPTCRCIPTARRRELARGGTSMGVEELGLALAAHVLAAERRRQLAFDDASASGRQARDKVVAAIIRIEQTSADDLGLADLAVRSRSRPISISPPFQKGDGSDALSLLVQTRIRRAIELLRDTSRPVTEIAFDVGFADLSNFINAFRREVGVSPRHYRQAGLAAGAEVALMDRAAPRGKARSV